MAQDIFANAGGTPGSGPSTGPDVSSPGPGAPPPGPDAASSGSVRVQSGDTLTGIAACNGMSLGALVAANPQIRTPT